MYTQALNTSDAEDRHIEDAAHAATFQARKEIRICALECYAAVALGVGGSELAPGERVARELIVAAPYRERGHELLMEILVARGNAAEALRVYGAAARACAGRSSAPHRHPELRELQGTPAAPLSTPRSAPCVECVKHRAGHRLEQ